ncbi:putative SLC11A3 iron transporter [Paratrimastix pyriformis]|uniref:Solute carrier family 40 member n=1 Tax=Paratrimastix pyriformis TaxID=342808 RepID=A0ABQ8V0S2_9EUKA|nr:putative SLC11A3 iron transporter [Paratrimastix pyriformis]
MKIGKGQMRQEPEPWNVAGKNLPDLLKGTRNRTHPEKTYTPSTVYSIFDQGSILIFGGLAGAQIDIRKRLPLVTVLLAVTVVAIDVCLVVMFVLYGYQGTSPWGWYALLGLLYLVGGVASLAQSTFGVAVKKDWMVVLAGPSEAELSNMNAWLRGIDMCAFIVAPFVVSVLNVAFSSPVTALIVAGWNTFAFIPEMILLVWLYRSVSLPTPANLSSSPPSWRCPDLRRPPGTAVAPSSSNPAPSEGTPLAPALLGSSLRPLWEGWGMYMREPVCLASVAMALLYVTTLSPHTSLVISWLVLMKIDTRVVAAFQGVSSVIGLLSSVLSPFVIRRLNIYRSAGFGLAFQVASLIPGCLLLSFVPNPSTVVVLLFCGTITISRFGLWLFDLSQTQIMQVDVSPDRRGMVNGVEQSLDSLGTILILIVGSIAGTPDKFLIPVWVSMVAVGSALGCYAVWYYKRLPRMHPELSHRPAAAVPRDGPAAETPAVTLA